MMNLLLRNNVLKECDDMKEEITNLNKFIVAFSLFIKQCYRIA